MKVKTSSGINRFYEDKELGSWFTYFKFDGQLSTSKGNMKLHKPVEKDLEDKLRIS